MDLSCTVFRSETNGDFGRILQFLPRVFNAPAKGFPLEVCNGGGAPDYAPIPDRQNVTIMSIRLDTIPALDRQTDGRNWQNNIALCMHFPTVFHCAPSPARFFLAAHTFGSNLRVGQISTVLYIHERKKK